MNEWFYGKCVSASDNHFRFIAIHKLSSKCSASIPQEYEGHYGVDIGGLANLTYEGDCSEVSEMDIESMLEKFHEESHEDCTENLQNEFDEESDETNNDSLSGSITGSNSIESSDDSSISSRISIKSSTSVVLDYSSDNSSSDGQITMRPGVVQVPDDDDVESDI